MFSFGKIRQIEVIRFKCSAYEFSLEDQCAQNNKKQLYGDEQLCDGNFIER